MSLPTKWLVAPKNRRHLDKLVGRSDVIPYFIRRKPFNGILDSEYGNTFTYRVKGAAQSRPIRKWIKTLIDQLDASLSIDFKQVNKPSNARIQFLAAKHVSKPWGKDTSGESIWDPKGGIDSSGLATVLVKKQRNPVDQMATITHELGHTLGLKHPKEKPYSPEFSTAITIMSYNEAQHPEFVYKEFTANDLSALASLWGLERGQSSPLATRVPFPVEDDCDPFDFNYDLSETETSSPAELSSKDDDYLLADELNSNLYGGAGHDTIIGSKGRDTLGGGAGDDVLNGGPGMDVLYGHEGKDRFVVREGEGKDEIHFFEQGLDVVHVKHDGGRIVLKERKDGISVLLDGNVLAIMKNIEYDFGVCSSKLAVIENQFIA